MLASPPLFNITALTLYDAGLQQGRMAAGRIRGWLSTDEMVALLDFTTATTEGRRALQQMKADNALLFPELVRELEGVAEGAGVPLDSIWVATLINELEILKPSGSRDGSRDGHCSDLFAVAAGGYAEGYAHGHNEDWPGPIIDYFYYVAYTAAPGADFESCAGFVYPGGLVGWAASWNSHGIFLTQNSLFPKHSRQRGLSSAFVQRAALCGRRADTLDGVASALTTSGVWASAASVNLVDLRARRMANVEIYEGRHGRHDVVTGEPPSGANYSHFNRFKEMTAVEDDGHRLSSSHRQARVDALPGVRTSGDIRSRLSDTADAAYPLFRNMTISSLVLDGTSGMLDAWCCGHRPLDSPPTYRWSLLSFF